MIESIFQLKWVVSRHQQAPLFKEREQFLAHCQQQGTSHKALNNMAPELIAVIRFLRMEELREVSLEEIKLAAEAWAAEQRSNPRARSYAKSASYFIFVAKKWLRFHGKLKLPSPPHARFANELDDFVAYMASEQGLSPISIRSHRWKRSKFLSCRRPLWMMLMSSLHSKRTTWNRESVSTAAQALRSFFRHAERRGWCKAGIAAGIQGPKICQGAGFPEGPTWDDVRRVLRFEIDLRPRNSGGMLDPN
jgi:integrase/recombinase XerD